MKYIQENLKEFELCNILEWHEKGYLGQGIKIAILENQADSELSIWEGKLSVFDYDRKQDKLVQVKTKDKYGNTHATGQLGLIHQILPKAQMYAMPSFANQVGNKVTGAIIKTLEFIVENNIDIVCSSTSGTTQGNVEKLIKKAQANNTIFFNAVGNSGDDRTDEYVNSGLFIDIGAVSYNDRKDTINVTNYTSKTKLVDFTGFSSTVEVADVRENKDRSFLVDGTSFSTPVVGAIVGLLKQYSKSKNKIFNQSQCIEYFKKYSLDLEEVKFDIKTGWGLIKLQNPNNVDESYFTNPINEEEEDMEVKLKIDSKDFYIDGVKKQLDVSPFIKNSRTFVPIIFLKEMGFEVIWNNDTREVTIKK